jgi:hypothetical protein
MGLTNCSSNPNSCTAHQLIDTPPSCACLQACDPGYTWDGSQCNMTAADSGVTDNGTTMSDSGTDSGVVTMTDSGTSMDATVTGVDAGPGFDPQSIASQIATAQCTNLTTCQPFAEQAAGETMAACVTRLTAQYQAIYTASAYAVGAGRASFSMTNFTSCLSAISGASCTTGLAPDACNFLTGTRAAGMSCDIQDECTTGNFCASNDTCGTCQAMVTTVGGDCTSAVCGPNLACAQVTGATPPNQCVPSNAALNGTCGTVQTGFCVGSLQCVAASAMATSGTCLAPVGTVGGACDGTGTLGVAGCDFGKGLICNQTSMTAQGTCAMASIVMSGACNPATQVCSGEAFCNVPTGMTSGTCSPLPGAGTACLNQQFCASTAHCDATTMNCVANVAAGGACTGGDCATNLFCVGPSGQTKCGPLTYQTCL